MRAARVFVGTSGWTYDDWWGTFYPEDLTASERLSYYATQFDTVEINATFYRAPTPTMTAAWNRRLGNDFHLVVKGSRIVTHLKKLDDCDEQLQFFLDRVHGLTRLKVILWQLPPGIHKDITRLEHFLSKLPDWARHAVEFRHKSWWDEEVRESLARHRTAFVAVSHPKLPDRVYATTDFLYVRFHGKGSDLYRYNYSEKELSLWVSMLKSHLRDRTVYAFFNNDDNANAPRNARTLREMISDVLTAHR